MPLIFVKAQRKNPGAVSDGNPQPLRGGYFGELITAQELSDGWFPSLSEARFLGWNPAPGTGIAAGIQTSYSATANVLMLLRNTDLVKYIVLEYIKLICSAAGASTTSSDVVIRVDSTNRYSAGGTAITPGNAIPGSAVATIAQLYLGAITATAESGGARTLLRERLKVQAAPCWGVGDTLFIGAYQQLPYRIIVGAGPVIMPIKSAPLIIPPGGSLTVHMWNTANATTPPSWELETSWLEM